MMSGIKGPLEPNGSGPSSPKNKRLEDFSSKLRWYRGEEIDRPGTVTIDNWSPP
jgi:hypothetical protein